MEGVFLGFFTRKNFHRNLGIKEFDFDPQQDILVDAQGNDPGVYTRAHELLQSYRQSHRYAVVVLDNAWGGSPGVAKIEADITKNLINTGWDKDCILAIAIDPELEAWVLQDNIHVKKAFRFKDDSLREWLEKKDLWDADKPKAADPKKAIEAIFKRTRTPRSSAIYKKITSQVSVKHCQDRAFNLLRDKLQEWFPVEEEWQ